MLGSQKNEFDLDKMIKSKKVKKENRNLGIVRQIYSLMLFCYHNKINKRFTNNEQKLEIICIYI